MPRVTQIQCWDELPTKSGSSCVLTASIHRLILPFPSLNLGVLTYKLRIYPRSCHLVPFNAILHARGTVFHVVLPGTDLLFYVLL